MLYDLVEDAGSLTPAEIRAAYDRRLAETIEAVGLERAAADSELSAARLEAVVAGEAPDLTLAEAASVLALSADAPDAERVVAETRDDLLMGMTTAVMDVDTIASNIDHDLTGQEVQQAIEGRARLTLDELAAIHRFIAGRG